MRSTHLSIAFAAVRTLVALLALAAGPARAQTQITLTQSSVIGGSPVFFLNQFDDGAYMGGNIFDQQSGTISMAPGDQPNLVWFPSEGAAVTNRFVTIDLGAAYVLSSIQIFNTNQADRGTGNFSLAAGNAVSAGGTEASISLGFEVTAPTMLINSTALTFSANAGPGAQTITGESFNITDPGSYRYLHLVAIDKAAGGGLTAPGIAEVRIYAAVPEPSTYAAILGLGALGLAARRRRRA